MPLSARARTHHWRPTLIALALCSNFAWAETSPYYIGLTQGFSRQSNVFSASSNVQSDTISSTGLVGGIDAKLGRQHLYANASAQAIRYRRFGYLNHISHNLDTGIDWETVNRLSGSLRYFTNQNLVNYADVQFPVGIKDVQAIRTASLAVRYAISPRIALEGGLSRRSASYSAAEDTRGFRQNISSLGLRVGGDTLLTVTAGLRNTKSRFPTVLVAPSVAQPPLQTAPGAYAADESDRNDVDLTVFWSPSGVSTLSARLSRTRETHSQSSIPKFSSTTGAISWDYKPTAKLALTTALTRDTGSEATFAGEKSNFLPLRTDSHRFTTMIDFMAKYAATTKILVNAQARHVEGAVVDSLGNSGPSSSNSLTLGAIYSFNRSIEFSCNLGYETRQSLYNARAVGCVAQLILR